MDAMQGEAPVWRQEVAAEQLPSDGRAGRRRRQDGEAVAQGRQRLPQVPREEELLAQGARRGHEPRGPSARRRQPPAHRPRIHRPSGRSSWSKVGPHRGTEDWKTQRASCCGSRQINVMRSLICGSLPDIYQLCSLVSYFEIELRRVG